jgi:hypothetical protein
MHERINPVDYKSITFRFKHSLYVRIKLHIYAHLLYDLLTGHYDPAYT